MEIQDDCVGMFGAGDSKAALRTERGVDGEAFQGS